MPHSSSSLLKSAQHHPLFWFLLWACLWALGFALLLPAVGCTHTLGGPRVGVSSASVVTLLRVKHAQPGDCTGGPDAQCRYADTWEPACTAFAVKGSGGVLLVTAAHCVPFKLGTDLRYYAPNGVGHDRALLVARDAVTDLAVLEPANPSALAPLERASVPDVGERVTSISSVYDASALGELVTELGPGYYETTQTIIYGWSGAPVLDAHGRVWGVVSKCPVLLGSDRCMAGHTYVAGLGSL